MVARGDCTEMSIFPVLDIWMDVFYQRQSADWRLDSGAASTGTGVVGSSGNRTSFLSEWPDTAPVGNSTRTLSPPPFREPRMMSPPCSHMIERVTERSRPTPPVLGSREFSIL